MEKPGLERRRRFAVVLILVLVFVMNAAAQHWSPTAPPEPTSTPAEQVDDPEEGLAEEQPDDTTEHYGSGQRRVAIEALGQLAVKERLPRSGYSREYFSSSWGVVDGCDMRNLILQRDLIDIVLDEDNCTVLAGVLDHDAFTGQTISFRRGVGTSGAIHIDHLVAVSDAWQKGAQALNPDQRWHFYNDSLNLLAVDGQANMQKGDKDAAGWLPQPSYRCRYVARQIAVKLKYNLWVTKAEHSAMKRVLHTCPNQVLPITSLAVD